MTKAGKAPTVDSGDWTSLWALSFDKGESMRLMQDGEGDFWLIQQVDGADDAEFLIPREQAVELAGALAMAFRLVVINEPEVWGNDSSPCSCTEVPARIMCLHCDDTLLVADPKDRVEWDHDVMKRPTRTMNTPSDIVDDHGDFDE